MSFATFSVRLTVSASLGWACWLLSVFLALDFIQDQESVRKGPLEGTENCSDCLSDCWLLFVSFWSLWLLLWVCEFFHIHYHLINWFIQLQIGWLFYYNPNFELLHPISSWNLTIVGLSKGVLLCFCFNPRNNKVLESLWQSLLIAEVTPKRLGTLQPWN